MNFTYKGFTVIASAVQINPAPNEVWRPMFRINGKDESTAWTPRDRSLRYATEGSAISEAKQRAQWFVDNSLVAQQ